MQYRMLGRLKVSRLCFGSLTIGPLQAGLSIDRGARVIRHALKTGVNFIDTAELYGTYAHIREALQGFDGEVVIVSKSYAYTYQGMQESVEKALREMNRNYIDGFMLHEQESLYTIRGHKDALKCLVDAKKAGLVRAVGISTHYVEGVIAASGIPEIDLIHPLINKHGIGIQGGSVADMLSAIRLAKEMGKGIYAMKALGGGNLLDQVEGALGFVLSLAELDSIAVGMQSESEVDYNVRLFNGLPVPASLRSLVKKRPRRLLIENWCRGCGNCVERCTTGALSLVENRVVVDQAKCRLCGYCGTVCPDFYIKII
ncbi:MAG: aldo/keto reductase [Peptococcaceae bacterium]|nr:MAG: aldo/keto reductase [Peptococcaceae bacterium]